MTSPEGFGANPASAVRAIVENLRSFWSVRSEPAPSGVEGIVWWTSGGIRRPLNGVLALEAADPGPHTDRIAATFRLAGLPCAWIEGPDPTSPELGLRLLALGYRSLEASQGWALPGRALAQSIRAPPGVIVRHGREPGLVSALGRLVGEGALQLGPGEIRPLELLLEPRGVLGRVREEIWIALKDGEPTAGLLTHSTGRTVGIFGLTTAPEHRSEGFASALVLEAARGASEDGADWIVAEAPDAHAGPYRRLGFEEYCGFRRYGWDPQSLASPGL